MPKSKYRPNDLLSEIDRDKTTLLRWEKRGLIPKARRDSRGWRWYTPEEYHEVVKKVRQTNYFGNISPAIVALLALGMGAISLLGFSRFAWGNTNLNMNVFDVADQGVAAHRGDVDGEEAVIEAKADGTYMIQPYQVRATARRGETGSYSIVISRTSR